MMERGTVQAFDVERRIGWIKSDSPNHTGDLFTHANCCLDELRKGDRVSFEAVPNERKQGRMKAINVRRLS